MPGSSNQYKKSLESRMRSVSLDCNGPTTGQGKAPATFSQHEAANVTTSQYHQNFQPMLKGSMNIWLEFHRTAINTFLL